MRPSWVHCVVLFLKNCQIYCRHLYIRLFYFISPLSKHVYFAVCILYCCIYVYHVFSRNILVDLKLSNYFCLYSAFYLDISANCSLFLKKKLFSVEKITFTFNKTMSNTNWANHGVVDDEFHDDSILGQIPTQANPENLTESIPNDVNWAIHGVVGDEFYDDSILGRMSTQANQ